MAASKAISVLLVDDDVFFAKVVQRQLSTFEGRDFKFLWKSSVEEALTELSSNDSIDIVLTDYIFPTSNGLEFCLQLNQMNKPIPIVFLTGARDFKLAVEAMKLGVEDFLLKEDLVQSQLPRTIIKIVDLVRMRRQLQAVEKRMTMAENRSQAIRELVVTVCHEFNNPLAAVKISSDLIDRSVQTDEERNLMEELSRHYQKIESEIRRLRDLNFEKFDYHGKEMGGSGESSGRSRPSGS
jgi:FixJ family two-component response regulator